MVPYIRFINPNYFAVFARRCLHDRAHNLHLGVNPVVLTTTRS
jgi:hypothetical protein